MASLHNVADYLPVAAFERPDELAVVDPLGRALTFRQLDAESDRLASGLHALGIRRGMRTVLKVPPGVPFFSLTFALFKLGAVLVLVDPGMGVRDLGRCLGEAEPEAFIGVRKAHLARRILGWARRTVRITIGVGTRLFCAANTDSLPEGEHQSAADVESGETAAILFTSGSTGVAKGAIYTHGMFSGQVHALRRLFDIRPGEIDLCTFPLFALFAPALGMTAIVPEMDASRPARVNPERIFRALEQWECTNLFGSPALLNAIGRAAERDGRTFPKLRRVISAGAPAQASMIERTARMLAPGVLVHTPYGATECLPVASIDSATILGETRKLTERGKGICVGRPTPGIDLAIIPVHNEPIGSWSETLRQPANVVGEIAVHGPFVSPAYYGRPDLTALAKIPDGAGVAWHRMGDLGYLDESGRLWFCGRKSHRVTTVDGPRDTIPCEAVFNTHPSVFRTALVGIGPPGRQTPVLCVELERGVRTPDRATLTRELLEIGGRFEHTRCIRTILFHKAFPVDVRHNAKIAREKLALWAAKRCRV